ncbi:Ulp1 peptidase [Sarracenia purpurea var. burkii]
MREPCTWAVKGAGGDGGCGRNGMIYLDLLVCTGTSDGLRQDAPSSLPASRSVFGACFNKKLLEENENNGRRVKGFENELKDQPKITLSLGQSPFQCPTNLSVDIDKYIHLNGDQNGGNLNGDQNGGNCSILSPHCFEKKLSGSLLKKYVLVPSPDISTFL